MQQGSTFHILGPEQSAYVAQRELGVTYRNSKNDLTYLGIGRICFLIGMRSLSLSYEEMGQVKKLKQNPVWLAQLVVCRIPPGTTEGETTGVSEKKDEYDAL